MAFYRHPLNRADDSAFPKGWRRAPHRQKDINGNSFNTCVVNEYGMYVWPIEIVLLAKKRKPTTAARIVKLHPLGICEGDYIRGVHVHSHKAKAFMNDVVPLREFEKRWGTRKGPAILFKQGRHKYVSALCLANGPLVP